MKGTNPYENPKVSILTYQDDIITESKSMEDYDDKGQWKDTWDVTIGK